MFSVDEIIDRNSEKFELLFEVLVRENLRFNLTAITQREEVFSKHFADSLAAVPYLRESASVIDIGTGAGFPALPLLIAMPNLKLTALDSVNKKLGFVNQAIELLGLSATTVHARAEDFARTHREQFDFAVSRAVAKLPTLVEYALPFVKVGGSFIAYKTDSSELSEASKAIRELGGGMEKVVDLTESQKRCLIIIQKIKNTPEKYPRGGNKPRTSPL